MLKALLSHRKAKASLTSANFGEWRARQGPMWVPLTRQSPVTVHDKGMFTGGPTVFKKWGMARRVEMVKTAAQESGLDAMTVEVCVCMHLLSRSRHPCA